MTERKNEKVEMIWEAPPASAPRSNKYGAQLAELKRSPGRWARLRLAESNSGAYGSRKSMQRVTDGDKRYEFIVRLADDGKGYGVWGRYRTPEQMDE